MKFKLKNSSIFIQENVFVDASSKMAVLMSGLQHVTRKVPMTSVVTLPHEFQAAPPAPSHYILPLIIIWSANCQEPMPLSCWYRWITLVVQCESQMMVVLCSMSVYYVSTVQAEIVMTSYSNDTIITIWYALPQKHVFHVQGHNQWLCGIIFRRYKPQKNYK